MPLPEEIKNRVNQYALNHLGDDDFFNGYFAFINDLELKERLVQEFRSVRYIYKILEGLQVNTFFLTAEIKIQILTYASIYEAILHHVLLKVYSDSEIVKNLLQCDERTRVSVAPDLIEKIKKKCKLDDDIRVYKVTKGKIEERKIIFEDKANAALELGLINQKVRDLIVDIYSLRNAIHLHAELRRDIQYEITKSRDAYWHMHGFCTQIAKKMEEDGKLIS